MDYEADETPLLSAETEMNELPGMYDAPAFSKRGLDLEFSLKLLHDRCRREREERLDMVRMRLRQWTAVASGPESSLLVFRTGIADLWAGCGVEPPQSWSRDDPSPRRLRSAAKNLAAGIERFNRRWTHFVSELKTDTLNRSIDHYNRYYLIEKECVLGSARLAARHFVAHERVTAESLLRMYPLLVVPTPI